MTIDLNGPPPVQNTHLATAQTLTSVARAEIHKVLAPGGLRVWWFIAVGLGLVSGVGNVFLANLSSVQEILSISVSATVGTGPMILLIVITIATAGYIPQEISDGTIVTAKRLVPRTNILFFGRLLGWGVGSSIPIAITAVIPLPFAILNPAVIRSSMFETAIALFLAILVPVLTVVLVHVGAIILRRGAYIVTVSLALLFFLPLLMAAVEQMMTGIVATAGHWIGAALIGPLIVQAASIPSDGTGTWAATAWSLLGVFGWLAATAAVAYRQFSAPGYGE